MAARPVFLSRFATIMTMIGVSVGLGNVWRFPYMMGKYGGSAFLFTYILFTVLFAMPALMAEWALGRETRKGPLGSFYLVFGNRFGKAVGMLLLFTVVVADSYYLVVIANVGFTAAFSLLKGFAGTNMEIYHDLLASGSLQYLISLLVLVISLFVISRGLNKGIAGASKIFVPFFMFIMAGLIIYVLTIPGTPGYLIKFLKPDITAFNREVIFAALGQSFFSLGLGGTFMLMYGSYMRNNEDIPTGAFLTSFGDMGAALMASLFIVPAILYFGLDMASGPGLIFDVFPELFNKMPMGNWLGGIFLLGLTMVAFLSNLAALEVIAGSFNELGYINLTRKRIIIGLGVVEALLMIPSSFYPDIIGYLDLIFGSGMQMFGSLLAIVGLTWGLSKKKVMFQIFGDANKLQSRLFYYWIRWVVPIALLLILISYISG
ncbi:MAG: sodium-dependent transporter [Bacteroidetes bacterium]|nr:sodium-dependent transporter [Bacteroidota bacterium]